ncbi:AAA family ATPase [Streptomyces sp. NPDC051907]|uniref:AAA family ATPase n=1 Tax=Streptomyces sp. NPDC051907 TaxID=3155284 RepID=UPI0034393D8E
MQGRTAERSRIEEMLAGGRAGTSSALLIHGEAGIGKTTLLDYAADRADGMRILRAEGVETEMELAFGGLHQLLLPALDVVDTLPGPQAAALRGVFGLTDDGARDRFTLGLAVLTMLAEIAGDGPLLCLVDDAQWLDQPSVEMLAFAARRLQAEGIVMIFAVRDGAGGATVKGLPALLLERLDRATAATLVPGLPPYVVERVVEEAQGNPLALIELSAALSPAQRAGQLSPLPLREAAPPMPRRIHDAFVEQIRGLPEPAQTLLLVAAVDDTGELPLVLKAAGRLGAALDDLEPAERAGLVLLSGEVLRFRHPLIRYAACRSAPLTVRIAAHRALAGVLDAPRHSHRRAWHLAAASTGPDEAVADELERVAEWAGNRQATASASAAYERAAQLTADPHRRARRLVRAAQKAADAGQDERCGTLADQVPLPLEDPGLAADFARVRAVVELGYGSPGAAARILVECADAIGAVRPDTLSSLLTDAVHAAFSAGDADLIAEVAGRAPHLPQLVVAACLFDEGAAGARDAAAEVSDVSAALDALADLVRIGRRRGAHTMDLLMTGIHCRLAADHATAREIAAAAVAHCRAEGVSGWLPTTLHLLAQTELALGLHADASAHAAEALRLAEYYDLAHRTAHLRALLAALAAVQGQEERTRRLSQDALAYTRPRSVGRGTADALWAQGLLELGLGRAESALELLESAYAELGHSLLALPLLPDLVESAVRSGRPERAREPARLLGQWAAALGGRPGLTAVDGRPGLAALAHRCQAVTAPDCEAEELFRQAVRLHEGHSAFDRARTQLLYGEWLRRQRRKVDARDQLRAALEDFDALDARPWSSRARSELRAAGETADLTGVVAGPVSRLSPQEREVVRLAAGGATNREIAEQLFLSPRTVGHHLYRAFPKLGVSTRAELAPLLAPLLAT